MGERLPGQKSYSCSFFDCKAKFTKSWKLEAHLCKHTGLKPFSCESCDRSFCTRYQLTRHELNHSGEKPRKCLVDGCPAAFVSNSSMKNHVARVHDKQEKQYQCNHQGCGKSFSKRNRLKAHQCEHRDLRPFHCSFAGCVMEFPTRGKMKHHEKVHAGYACENDVCSFKGNTWTEYVRHRREHKAKLPCGECKKLFSNAWFLHLHQLRTHSGGGEEEERRRRRRRRLPCPRDGCEKQFTRRFNLESHIRGDHEGERPFSCAVAGCDKSFAMKESLWRHGVVHDPAKKRIKKLHPRTTQPWRAAPAANQAEVNKLTAELLATTLV